MHSELMTLLKKHITKIIPILCALFIAVLSYIFLYEDYSDVLRRVETLNLFTDTMTHLQNCLKTPGGLLTWGGTYLTQLFYHPEYGVTVLSLIWIVTFFLIQKAFSIKNIYSPLALIPVVCLLISILQLGYWIYYMKHPGYFFCESLGVMAVALLVLFSRAYRYGIIGSVIAALTYPLFGYYSLVALLCIATFNAINKNYIATGIAVVLGIVSPLIQRNYFTTIHPDASFTVGFPLFAKANTEEFYLSMPFVVIIIALVILSLIHKLPEVKGKKWAWTLGCAYIMMAVGMVYTIKDKTYDDECFKTECKVYIDAEQQNWDGILNSVSNVHGNVTRELVVMKNIALFNTGEIGDKMYHYEDMGMFPNVKDSLKVAMADTSAPLIFLYHGRNNFAYRWSVENAVEYGYNIANLKIITLTSLIAGETKAAEKYLNILSHTMYHKEWADHYRPALKNPKLIHKYPEMKNILSLYNFMSDRIDSDQGLCEHYIQTYFSNSICVDNMFTQEVCMAYALMSKDIQTFWKSFFPYAQSHDVMPIHYQEAAYLYGKLEPQTMDTSHMPFDKERIIDRYATFNQRTQQLVQMGMSEQSIGEATKTEFGDTYWWAYYFVRGLKYY